MSVQFGIWNCDGRPVDPAVIAKARLMLTPYGPDDSGLYCENYLGILYCAFHTTEESSRQTQPLALPSGALLVWDGRLDNRTELVGDLNGTLTPFSADVSIVAAAYERWGPRAFARLVGDWALSLWNPNDRSLTLVKDPVGTRHLYYSFGKDQVCWSTILDPLVLLADRSFRLDPEYLAGWFSLFPATHCTPYLGVHAVPPSSSVVVRGGKHAVTKYWDFDPHKEIRYASDGQYEEQFRTVFAEAVRRRLRSHTPILAELSGGTDSSSIVCMADLEIAQGASCTPRLDTVSWFDDSEPDWNERPYFTKVEEKRGRTGCHINAQGQTLLFPEYDDERFAPAPWSALKPTALHLELAGCLRANGNRVVLSGLGGDEILGGVPTPAPELAGLLVRGHLPRFAKQAVRWALAKRKPVAYLVAEAVRQFLPARWIPLPEQSRPPAWLRASFVKKYRTALTGYEKRWKLFGPLPAFQENLAALEALRRQLECFVLPSDPPHENRYPYLDRGLLEFIYAIPREQLLRPLERRSLMRRALAGIVPEDVLNRKRKAGVTRGPRVAISLAWPSLVQLTQRMVSSSLGIVDSGLFLKALENAAHDPNSQTSPLRRVIAVELWLRHLDRWTKPRVTGSATNEANAQLPDDWDLPVRAKLPLS